MTYTSHIPVKKIKSSLLGFVFASFTGILVIFSSSNSYNEAIYTSEPCLVSVIKAAKGEIKQDDPALINYIQQNILLPPDELPYNLDHPEKIVFSNDAIEFIFDALFGNKTGGTFFEAGAFTGEEMSNTLYLEKSRSWSGLLVEASPDNSNILKSKHRKAWVAPTCISATDQPMKVKLMETGPQTWIENYQKDGRGSVYLCPQGRLTLFVNDERRTDPAFTPLPDCSLLVTKESTMHCFPLYSLLTAAGINAIDFMSLDVEGLEIDILRALPFEKVDIKVLLVEVSSLLENASVVTDFLHTKGYRRRKIIGPYDVTERFHLDYLFIKSELTLPIE